MSGTIRETAFAAIDFESARLADRTDVPVQVGVAWMERGEVRTESFLRSWICPPAAVHSVTREVILPTSETLQQAPRLPELWNELNARLRSRVLIGHGAGTERRFLRAYPLHGFGPWIDSLLLARSIYPTLPSHALGDLIAHFQLEGELARLCPRLAWHDALYDAVASLLVVRQLMTDAELWDRPAEWLEHPRLHHYHASRRKVN